MQNNIIQKDGKHYQIGYPVLLCAINARTNIWKMHNKSQGLMWLETATVFDGEPQHLSILSDEEIKKPDWAYDTLRKRIVKCTEIIKADIFENDYLVFEGNTGNPRDTYKKIIATTDKSLIIWSNDGVCEHHRRGDILPSIPNNFLQAYVEAQGKMEKVLIEVKQYKIKENDGQGGAKSALIFDLKLSPDNTITIIPFEEKQQTFSREEAINILIDGFVKHFYPNPDPEGSDHEKNRNYITKWFNKNY